MGRMTSPETARERLARLMAERRTQLRMTWNAVADKAGLTKEGLRGIRQGQGIIQPASKEGIEDALRWERGSLDAILEGRDPVSRAEFTPKRLGDLADLVRLRRDRFGLEISDAARQASLSLDIWASLELGTAIGALDYQAVDRALGWRVGSSIGFLRDGVLPASLLESPDDQNPPNEAVEELSVDDRVKRAQVLMLEGERYMAEARRLLAGHDPADPEDKEQRRTS